MPRAESKYGPIIKDLDVKRWLKNLARGSPVTAEVAVRRISRACELLSKNPKEMVDEAKNNLREFQDFLEDMVARLEAERKSPGYIQGILKVVKSWLKYNDVTLTRKIKVSNSTATPTIENEQVPSQEELARIFRVSPPRIRVAEALMAFADLRPESIGNYDGSDGLRLKDLPELKIENGQVVFEKVPTMITVRSTLSKARHKYFTFLSSEGCTYLKEYLEERIRFGEDLRPESPLIAHERKEASVKPFLMTKKITHFIRQCMRKAGVYKRPYVLRAYAETQLIIAESKGKISHPYLQFIAGHKGDIEARYSTNKGVLPPDMIEDIRKSYKECEPFLSTTAQPLEQSSVIKEAKIEALKSIAKSLLGIELLEVKVAKEKEIGRELSKDEELELFESELKKLREGKHNPQRIVHEKELERHLAEGWQFVSVLPSQKILIKK
ncbi:MAG: site-specific integrase [archaeon]|nr:site-specific integrase [archaeon]MCP8314945.1 site-specific integrase [archaeon]